MNSEGLPILGPNIDLSQIEPTSPQRTLAYLNFFISETVSSLNKFSSICDHQLHNLNLKTQQLDTTLSIIEGKLSSINGLEEKESDNTENVNPVQVASKSVSLPQDSIEINDQNLTKNNNTMTNKENPMYKKYFMMLSMGIQMDAVKQKMIMENIDANIIEHPNDFSTLIPENMDKKEKNSDCSDSDDLSDFDD